MALRTTLSMSATVGRGSRGVVTVANHVLAGRRAISTSTAAALDQEEEDEPEDEEDEGEEAAEDDGPSQVSADGWRRTCRAKEPEKAKPALMKLKGLWEGAKIRFDSWSLRRRPMAKKVAANLASAARKRLAGKAVRQQSRS